MLFGPPGGGKSHLAAAIGLALVENGWRVLFMRTSDLVQRLQIARRELALESALTKLDKYHLLILDDIVYVSKDQAETSVLFELIGTRYERRCIFERCFLVEGPDFSGSFCSWRMDARTLALKSALSVIVTRPEMSGGQNVRDAPVLDPGRGRTKKGYFWAIARDDRPWSGTDPPAVAYSYAPGRGAIHALKLLENYRGVVQCDGYAAYKTIADKPCGETITLAFCWSHLRRKFFDIAKDGNAPIASEALVRIAAIYAIEKTIRGRSADERRALRQEKSKPLVLELKTWFAQQLARVSRKSPVADAIRYAQHHWEGLTRSSTTASSSSTPTSSNEASDLSC